MDISASANEIAQPSIDVFLNSIISDKFGTVDPETINEMKADLLPRLQKWINLKTMTVLAQQSQDTLTQFQDLIQKEGVTPEEIQDFIRSKIPDSDVFLAKVLLEFRNTYMGV